MIKRQKILLNGIVQGVGFRPFVYRLANECELKGFVNNSSRGVHIEVEGAPDALEEFKKRLFAEAPAQAKIMTWDISDVPLNGDQSFTIQGSIKYFVASTMIPPDLGICDDCLRELFDARDRRYRYPFINCTNCGPRYTIVHSIPYDRVNTSMRVFRLCPDCENEYHDPSNRRFHAQPNACPDCGPGLRFYNKKKKEITAHDPIEATIKALKDGGIVAVRGIGGFHLAVDAHNDEAIRELRRRKRRAEKPFALMADSLDSIKKYCHVSAGEEKLLQHPARPIVLLRKRTENTLAPAIAPGNRYLGFMLAYSPLHHLLLRDQFDALVMTSGNISEEPIAISNDEAFERLRNLADYFLVHNREILQRCDDSIVREMRDRPQLIRRARGYVPAPVILAHPIRQPILACGGELKNTIALSRGENVFLSQHIGDLDNPAAFEFFENTIEHFQKILEIKPRVIAYDMHPEYLSTKWARKQQDMSAVAVQHHHAHLAAVMAENGVREKTIGIILDGTGYGLDGTIWGGEVLVGDAATFDRYAWLSPVPMPGGAAAIRQPWRMALSYLFAAYGDDFLQLDLPLLHKLRKTDATVILRMIKRGINVPLTSSCGRLFDAVAALLDLRSEINYEAQAAIELEMQVDESVQEIYENILTDGQWKNALPGISLFKAVAEDFLRGGDVGAIAARFHRTVAELFIKSAGQARSNLGVNRVGLSGGVFQNEYFFNYIARRLEQQGFQVLTHSQVPTNDGGLALGQIVVADARMAKESDAGQKDW